MYRNSVNIFFFFKMSLMIQFGAKILHTHVIIPTQCFYRFSAILIGPLVKLNGFYTSIKTRAYEYLISGLISQC